MTRIKIMNSFALDFLAITINIFIIWLNLVKIGWISVRVGRAKVFFEDFCGLLILVAFSRGRDL